MEVHALDRRRDLVAMVSDYQVSQAGMTGPRPDHDLGDNAIGDPEDHGRRAGIARVLRYGD